ncbi:class I SAM-dependent methyltransferase [Brachybacterium sp. DNPG3]
MVEAIVAALPDSDRASADRAAGSRVVVDLGAGTGKLSLALASRGTEVIAVDPSESMLRVLGDSAVPDGVPGGARGSVRTVVGTAEATGLADGCAEAVASAQAWHWFDTEAASAEARRLLKPGGVLALVWNTMDVQIPWVHRFSRIMHAGDVQKDDFAPPVAAGFELVERIVVRWEDPMPTQDLIDLARTRSYVITASEATRAKVLGNLDWYLHEHLGHAPGDVVGLPYRTDLFLFRAG